MSFSIAWPDGGGPGGVCGTVAQPEIQRLSARRAITPPRIDVPLAFNALDVDGLIIPLNGCLATHKPQDNPTHRPQQCQDPGDHLPLLLSGEASDEVYDLLQGSFRLVPWDHGRHGDRGDQNGRDCTQVCLPVIQYVV